MKKFNLTLITKELTGVDYKLGEMDCFNLIITYLRMRGSDLPDEFKGLTLKTYAELYRCAPKTAYKMMFACMNSVAEPVLVEHIKPGDILLLKLRAHSGAPFLAINGGNATAIFAAPKEGVIVASIHPYKIQRGWKCLVSQQP